MEARHTSASFKVPKPHFPLEFLMVQLDPPAQLGKVDEIIAVTRAGPQVHALR